MGKTALKRDDFKRTKHPIYSFAVWSADQELLCNMDNKDAFGDDSLFQYMVDKNVKNIQNTLAILLRSDYNKTHEACLKECRTGKTRKRRMRV